VTLENATLKFSAPRGSYEGKLTAAETTMNGTFTGDRAFPLELHRATPETGSIGLLTIRGHICISTYERRP